MFAHRSHLRAALFLLLVLPALIHSPAELWAQSPDPTPILQNPGIITSLQPKGGSAPFCGTTYIGFVPGKVSANNYWGLGKGNFVPGSNVTADYGYWGWDNDGSHNNIADVHGDSLFGWWPYRHLYTTTGSMTLSDDNRPWWALDMGNNANYRINLGPAHKRTFGVVGVWHRDNGSTSGGGVAWAPLSGTYSLWCGLRREGDNSFVDPITGNAFNSGVLQYNDIGSVGTTPRRNFPGYGSQWDQMAYRDINITGQSTISVRFKFRSNMSKGFDTTPATRTGWFDKDPLQVTASGAAAGNFISSSAAGVNAPIDSFMVYVGAPVNDAAWVGSDGATRPVYDPQRRWFSEVLKSYPPLYKEIFIAAGDKAVQTVTVSSISTAGWGNRARLVFRNKTNRGFDDETGPTGGYSSGGQGAVVIDDVEVALGGGSFTTLGDFETAGQVDNNVLADPINVWKTTGKPPAIFHHVHDVFDLIYEDVAGPVGSSTRICQLSGNVISSGDHDQSEASGGTNAGAAERERSDGIVSPTLNLRNGGGTNAMDINPSIASANEIYIAYDIYAGIFDLSSQGNAWRYGWQAWPARQPNGNLCWGDWHFPSTLMFNPVNECFQDREPAYLYGLLSWSAPDAEGGATYPDSLRIYLGKEQQCFKFGLTATCSPNSGCYFDNVSVAFVSNPACLANEATSGGKGYSVNGTPPPGATGPLSADIGQWINDTFTVNGLNRNGVAPGTVFFDTTTALVKTGLNMAQVSGNTLRYAVPGDTSVCVAVGSNLRVDLVFRIDPGPGNYVTLGNKNTSLRRVPTSITAVNISAPTGRNFWEEYLLNDGTYGSAPGHPADGTVNGGKRWSSLVWNSARCDTAEQNMWPINSRGIGGPALGLYATMYHEADPKFLSLGIAKNRCFLTTATAAVTQANIVCDIALTDGWPIAAGYVAESGQPLGKTYEYTKILPDGMFTPGTHVEYYLRREDSPIAGGPYLAPDPTTVSPQLSEGSVDAHRWQEFSVLPDNWKKGAYGGLGQACMLYVDLDDRRGDERVWVSVADSIGATQAVKFGSHNGWFAQDKVDINNPINFVEKNSQPGTTWDMYGVKASESLASKVATLGVALSNHASSFQIDNKWSFQGPSLAMLEAYYKVLLILTGDLNSQILGAIPDLGGHDTDMLQSFMLGGTATDHRGVWIEGEGFVESNPPGPLLAGFLYVSLHLSSYTALTGNNNKCIDLVTLAPITTNGDIYGIQNDPWIQNDVLFAGTRSVAASLYSPAGFATPPVIASVYHPVNTIAGEYWESLVDGWDIWSLRSRFCDKTHGRLAYAYNVLTNIFGSICQIAGNPLITTDVPNNGSGELFVDAMGLRNNPLRSGFASVEFALARADRVEVKVFDVSGRLLRVLADRQFAPGRHELTWDGTDRDGREMARGVYFTQVRYLQRGFNETRKLVVLR